MMVNHKNETRSKLVVLITAVIHTIIWFIFASAIMYVCYAGALNKVNRLVWFCIGAIVFEGVVLLINKGKCPLISIAGKYFRF